MEGEQCRETKYPRKAFGHPNIHGSLRPTRLVKGQSVATGKNSDTVMRKRDFPLTNEWAFLKVIFHSVSQGSA